MGLVLVAPESLALVFAVIPELLGRQPVEWLRTAAASWLTHGPPVWARIGFLAGALWLLLGCGECAAAMAVALPPLGGGKGGAGRAASGEPLLLSELGTNRTEIQQLVRRKLLWNGFMRAVKWYEARRDAAEEWPALVDLRARLVFALAAARARRDQSGRGGVAPTENAHRGLRRVLHGVAAASPAVTLPRLAGALNQPKDRVAAGLMVLEELGLVRLALTPAPIVAQVTELGTALLADPDARFLAAERLDDRQRAVLRQRIAVIAARIRPARTHVGPDLRLRREQRASRASRNPAPSGDTVRRGDGPGPGAGSAGEGPVRDRGAARGHDQELLARLDNQLDPGHGALAVLSARERGLAYRAYTAVYDAARRPEWHGRAVRNRGPPPAGTEELFSPDAGEVRVALERWGATPGEVERVLRAWAFSWRDADGVVVVAVFADRLAELGRLGLLERVLQHERRDVAGEFPSKQAHDRDVEIVQGAIQDAQAAGPGPALALLAELPRGGNSTASAAPIDVAIDAGCCAVAVGGLDEADRVVVATRAAELAAWGTPLDRARHPHLPRGPPQRVVVVPARARVLLGTELADRLIAIGGSHAPGGVMLVFEDTVAEIDALIAQGRLSAGWWQRLLSHRDESDATRVAQELSVARLVALGAGGQEPEDVAAAPSRAVAAAYDHLEHLVAALSGGRGGRVAMERRSAAIRAVAELDAVLSAVPSTSSDPAAGRGMAAWLYAADSARAMAQRVLALVDSWGSTTEAVDPRFWETALRVLGDAELLSPGLRTQVLSLLLRTLPRQLVHADADGAAATAESEVWAFAAGPGWVSDALARANGGRAPKWLGEWWQRASHRDRFALATLIVATDWAPWVAALPKARRSWRHLADHLTLLTVPELRKPLEPVHTMLEAVPEPGSPDLGWFLRSWMDLAATVVWRHQVEVPAGVPDRTVDLLTRLAEVLPDRSPASRARLLDRAVRARQAQILAAAGRSVGVSLRGTQLTGPAATSLAPGTPAWNALVGHRDVRSPEFSRPLASYLRELARTGDTGPASSAFRRTVREELGLHYRFAPNSAQSDQLIYVDGVPMLVGVEHDRVEFLSFGYPNLHCMDCVTGSLREFVEDLVLNLDLVLLRVWTPTPSGRGRRLGQLTIALTEQGVLPLEHPIVDQGGGHRVASAVGTALGAHLLLRWASPQRPLLKAVDPTSHYDPSRLPIPGRQPASTSKEITLPGPAYPSDPLLLWADVLADIHPAPSTVKLKVQRFAPDREEKSQVAGRFDGPGLVDRGGNTIPGGSSQPGHGALGVLTPRERELAYRAYTAVYDAARRPEWHGRAVRNRGPPPAEVGAGEELFSPDLADVRLALQRLGATPAEVELILRAWAFSWRDPVSGTVVFAVFEPRRVVLEQIGLWEEVLQHERRHVDGGFASADEHDTHVRELTGRIDRAVVAGPGAAGSGQIADPVLSGPPGVASPIAPRAPPGELLQRLRSTDAGDPEFWGRAGQVLELIVRDGVGRTGDARAIALQRTAETLLAGSLRGGRELADDYLGWIAWRLGSPSWLATWWPTATLPGRIALGVLVALVGGPEWLRELPKKRRDPRDIRRLVQLWTDQDLAEHATALTDGLSAVSAIAATPRSEIYGSWISLVHASVVVATNSDPGSSSRVLDALRSLPGSISAAGPQGNVVALLADAAAVIRAVGTGAAPPPMRVWPASSPGPSVEWPGTVRLYHGTTDAGAASIRSSGIQLSAQRDRTDFGTGFYTTPDRRDAQRMARKRAQTHGGTPVVLRFDVPAATLHEMSGMTFPGANLEYRDFVRLMRTKGLRHTFDWVRGPVLYNVRDFLTGGGAHTSGDQVSFHTPQAVQVLTAHLVEERAVQRSAGRNRFDCPCGESHWGLHGAAGLLLWYRDSAETDWFLLQQRSRSDYAGTWGLLGGAREPGESAEEAAIREAWEEGGLDPAAYTVLGAYLDDHGGWGFTTAFAGARSRDIARRRNRETSRLEWIRRDQIHTLNLHPGLAATWNELMRVFLDGPENEAVVDPGPQRWRSRWSTGLADMRPVLPADFEDLERVVSRWIAAAAALVGGDPRGGGWPRAPPVFVHGQAVGRPADHEWLDGILHIRAADPVGALGALVESLFAPHSGFGPEQSRLLAALVPLLLEGRTGAGEPGGPSWAQDRIDELFAEWSRWRGLAQLHADGLTAALIAVDAQRARPVAVSARDGSGWLRSFARRLWRRTPDTTSDSGAAAAEPATGGLTVLGRPRPNLKPDGYRDEVVVAAQHGILPALVGRDDLTGLVSVNPVLKGVVTLGGEMVLIPAGPDGQAGTRAEDMITFSHAYASGGRDVQLAFMLVASVKDGSTFVVEEITPFSGHYNDGNTLQQNLRGVFAVRIALEAHEVVVRPGAGSVRVHDPADPDARRPGQVPW